MELKYSCPSCGNNTYKSRGWNKNRTRREFRCTSCGKNLTISNDELEYLTENVRLAKKVQRFSDFNRLERKTFRNFARIDNALEDLNSELIRLLKENSLSDFTINHKDTDNSATAIIHFTDAHFNELVDLSSNKYDFNIASKRCKKFVDMVKKFLSSFSVSNVVLAMTGDLINSDRRYDEIMHMATNRSKAVFLAVYIVEQIILDLNKEYNVIIASIVGNESRVRADGTSSSKLVATDNYDYTICNMLQWVFKDSKGVSFIIAKEDPSELIINVAGRNILLFHGHQSVMNKDPQQGLAKIYRKYMDRGITIDFSIFGHFHEAYIGDLFARGGAIVGGNAYSDGWLQLPSKASQNLHIITPDSIHSIKIDLQNTEDIEGYNIKKELESYEAKSYDKVKRSDIISKIRI